MKIVLDTNFFCKDFHLVGFQTFILSKALELNNELKLYVPEVVIDEVANRFKEESITLNSSHSARKAEWEGKYSSIEEIVNSDQKEFDRFTESYKKHLEKSAKKALKLKGSPVLLPRENEEIQHEISLYKENILSKLTGFGVTFLPYPDVGHKELVERDLQRKRPFQASGKGYRDTLIWYSILGILDPNESLFFITENSNDFGKGPRPHEDLLGDINNKGCNAENFFIISNVYEFNNKYLRPFLMGSRLSENKTLLRFLDEDGFSMENAPSSQDHLVIDFEVNISGNKPVVNGVTNLPDGTNLGAWIENSKGAGVYFAQDSSVVIDKKFSMGPFSDKGQELASGIYNISVTMPVPHVQPDSIREQIGQKGEKLKGDSLDFSYLGVSASKEKQITIGDLEEIQTRELQLLYTAESIYARLQSLFEMGKEMTGLREKEDLASLRKCGELMRIHQTEIKALETVLSELPNEFIHLKIIPPDLHFCVSCHQKMASERMPLVEENLKKAEQEITEYKQKLYD